MGKKCSVKYTVPLQKFGGVCVGQQAHHTNHKKRLFTKSSSRLLSVKYRIEHCQENPVPTIIFGKYIISHHQVFIVKNF